MEVSYRQAKRLYRRYRAEGAKGLKHRSAGRRSNRATDARQQERVLALIPHSRVHVHAEEDISIESRTGTFLTSVDNPRLRA